MGNQTASIGTPSEEGAEHPVWLQSEDSLRAHLEGNGVSTDQFGTGSANSLVDLLHELRTQACFLEFQPAKGSKCPRALRIVEPVFIRLCWGGYVLVEEEQEFADGRLLARKMLLAGKKELRDGGGLLAAVVRVLHEELGLDAELLQQDGVMRYRADAYHFELEHIDSPSYPGLPSVYRTHHVQVDITEEGLGLFRLCGLPGCEGFSTVEDADVGRTTHHWRWYDVGAAAEAGVAKLPPQALPSSIPVPLLGEGAAAETTAWQPLSPAELPSIEALMALLEQAGLDPARYGTGQAKTIESLFNEVQAGESRLERHVRDASLRHVTEPVFVRLLWRNRVLVQARQNFNDGRTCERNTLLAKKRSHEDADASITALRGLREELSLPEDFPALDGLAQLAEEAYCCAAETLESSSYPGLSSVFITHYCGVRILDAGAAHFQKLGMLADEFETAESGKVNCWRWMPVEEARRADVKGFLATKEPASGGDDAAGDRYELLTPTRLEPSSLRVLLEAGGVRVSSWGSYADASLKSLARELKSGAAQLERQAKTGGLRRVIKSSLVQFVIEEESDGIPSEAHQSLPSDVAVSTGTSSPTFTVKDAWGMVRFRLDLGCFEVAHADAASYPGLACCHRTRLLQFEQRRSAQAGELGVEGSPEPIYAVDSEGFAVEVDAAASAPKQGGDAGARRGSRGYPRLLDGIAGGHGGRRASGGSLALDMDAVALAEQSGGRRRSLAGHRSASIVSRDDGLPMCGRPSLLSLSSVGDPVMISEGSTFTPKRRSLYRQLRSLQQHLRFKMVANEAQHSAPPPAEQAVACACDILLIRNVNPLNATFHCRFVVFLEWLDSAAVGLPRGAIAKEKLKEISTPEVGLQNTLGTSLEVHSPPEVVNSESGHVACKVLFQALMQMELDMRLFPFDEQRLVLVLGLRARKDRSRAVFCQFCHVDRQIRLDEWRLTGSFYHADRPDGRARVQFGVVISRAYWYYIVNVLATLVGIASTSLVGFLLHVNPPFDRLRFGVAVLFAQTTFRLSIENKLPKVSYATAFDRYAMFCQLLVLSIMVGNAVSSTFEEEVARVVDPILASVLGAIWILGNALFVRRVSRLRRQHHASLRQLSDQKAFTQALPESSAQALQQLETLKGDLHFRGDRRVNKSRAVQSTVCAVSVATRIWLLHDIDPISATFECKFTVYLEWIQEGAVGLPEGEVLSPDQLASLDPPELDVHNKVELTVEAGPCAWVVDSSRGQIRASYRYHARLQIHLNLRRFPFDSQRLPINLTMPNEKDHGRAFVYRNCHLAQTARRLDEWLVDGLVPATDYTDGVAQAMLEVCIRRRSMYYVVSVLLVLLGISSLVFTVFVIDVDAGGEGFADQGKILVPLLMTLLAFKLLIASGKIPKAAYATIFDRIMLACEVLFFLTTLLCAATLLLAIWPQTASIASAFRTHVALVLLTAWLLYGVFITLEVRCGREDGSGSLSLRGWPRRSVPSLGQQRRGLAEQPELSGLLEGGSAAEVSSAVLAGVEIQQVHSVNATTATFVCEFVVSMAWISAAAKGLPIGEALSAERLAELQAPVLRVQNALTFKHTLLSACVVSSESGHVACKTHIRAQLQLHFKLDMFPYDRQALAVVLTLPEPQDARRHLVLQGCSNHDAVKISEWSLLGTFAEADRLDSIPQVVFGVTIQRSGHYYIASLRSLCLWAASVFTIYTLDVEEFHDRGKILVCVLLVTIVGKLAVSSKLPRIARLTSYDKVATNARIARSMRPSHSSAHQSPPDAVPPELRAPPDDGEKRLPDAAAEELGLLRQATDVFAPQAPSESATPSDAGELASTASEMILAVSVGIKIWMVCNVEPSTATFECKFHVFLDWYTLAAVDMPENTHISTHDAQGTASKFDLPRLRIQNTICVLLEDWSDIQVKDSVTGQVSCRVQYHVRMYHGFNLRRFPFDCQRLEIPLELQNCQDRFLVAEFCEADDQTMNLDGWMLAAASMYQHIPGSRQASIRMLVERESYYYVLHVIAIFFFLTTLMFSFYLMRPHEITKRLVDVLKIVLTQTTFRFSVEHRLPKVQHWTPFDMYVSSCQALCCCIILSFIYSAITSKDPAQACMTQELEHYVLACLTAAWLLWNVACAVYAGRVKHRELRRWQLETLGVTARRSTRRGSRISFELPDLSLTLSRSSVCSSPSSSTALKPWESEASSVSLGSEMPQVISIAFRIWLVRNVDLVTATFECKFRVFLEWLDEDAIGLPKGKKAKLPVPLIAITNAVQSQILDRSSAPEVVNSETGHLAVQILYRATLRMDQEVHQFPFDCQWLAITLSLRDEGAERSRSFMFQYCEVDGQLQLDEWQVHPQPAFSTLTKDDAPSIQDTVMCGILIRRNSRYYVVNIMGMLCLISSLVFAIYTIDVRLFWERAEVFLGIFPLIVLFKMSAQGKLPRVGYSTKFDLYASSCQILFLVIVLGCMLASVATNLPIWLAASCPAPGYNEDIVVLVRRIESYFTFALLILWIAWNAYFTLRAWMVQRLTPLAALRSPVQIRLQHDDDLVHCSAQKDPDVNGLAPRLSEIATQERCSEVVSDT